MIKHEDNGLEELMFSNMINNEHDFIPLITDSEGEDLSEEELPGKLPILPLRNTVLFPGIVIPISVGRNKSLQLVKEIYQKDRILGAVCQKDINTEEPTADDLHPVGTVGHILKLLEMPDESTTMIIQGKSRFRINEFVGKEPYLLADITKLEEDKPDENDKKFEATAGSVKDMAIQIVQLSSHLPQEATFAIKNIENPFFLINYVCTNIDIKPEDKQKLLEIDDFRKRSAKLLKYLAEEIKKLQLKNDIQTKVKLELDQQQREYFLNQQIKTIQNELGGNPTDLEINTLLEKGKKKKWNKDTHETFIAEVEKLKRINPTSPEYSNQLNYVELLVDLPWNEYTKDNLDLKRALRILDKDHFGLDQAKERILEYLAVLKLKGDLKSPILCLYGPPGVGKTSLGKSVAKALARKYIRMSLGGLHDEAEIRGHRKTYIGAMPGRIIQNLKKAKTANPVFILDEIDKVGNDYHGDPSSALLEVLDPEQNSTFYDNYLELEFDLSKVMFIATANSLSRIKPALLDRMELIYVTGYIVEEKIEIAKRHLIPKQLEMHGVTKKQVIFNKEVIEDIIENYTYESGVRKLDKVIAKVIRSVAKKIGFNEAYNPDLSLEDLREILGPPKYLQEKYEGNDFAGVVTGLAWTAVGGKILFIETSLSKGRGGNLTLTGNLGFVMKESAIIALEYLKANASKLDIKPEVFEEWNVHIHVPEGAIPKDGPSAGITMLTSLASAFTQRKVKKKLAMTGEITLRGKVLPVGGIKEKILAAKRADIREIILSKDNEKDITEIKKIYRKGLRFHYVDTAQEVLEIALLKQKITNAIPLVARKKEEQKK